MRTLRVEDFTDEMKTLLGELHAKTQSKLKENGVEELMPVQ